MMKDLFIVFVGIALAAGLYSTWLSWHGGGVACTAEAKMCPDGSYVGRQGPDCEFAPCPSGRGIQSFEDCANAGYPVMESYPRQCNTPDGRHFTEDVGSVGEFYGVITGTVLLGPTCPVESYPPDPRCADRPYSTTLALMTPDGASVIKEFSSDANGSFYVEVPPGEYAIRSVAVANILPYCAADGITVEPNGSAQITVSCDSGIR